MISANIEETQTVNPKDPTYISCQTTAFETQHQVSNEEAKLVEIVKLQMVVESLNLESSELRSQLGVSIKEKSALERRLVGMVNLDKENAFLKSSLESLEKQNSVMELELVKGRKDNNDTIHKLRDVEEKHVQLQVKMLSLEEKLLSLENEIHVLRQKAVSTSPKSNHPGLANSFYEDYAVVPVHPNNYQKREYENHEFLRRCIKEDLGFKDGKPLAACIIYKCLLHWRAFESKSCTTVEIVAEGITNVIQVGEVNYILPYWLSNVSALLCLLHKNLGYSGFFSTPSQRSAGYAGFAGRMTQDLFSPSKHLGGEENMQINAQYPAIVFKQKLTSLVESIYNLIRDKLKKDISPLLNVCLQVPKSARAYAGKSSRSPGGVPQQSISSQWDGIIKFLDSVVNHLHENHVPSLFIRMLTTQVFAFINFTMFNSLLMRRECCTFTNGNYWNSFLDELEKWAVNVTKEFSGSSVHKLTRIKQAVRFLLIHQKNKKSLDEITQDLCPALTVMQIQRICTIYWDDTYGTKSVSAEVVEQMREIVHKDSQNIKSNSFLLDDDSSIPFLIEDIPKALPEVDTSDIAPPPFMHEYACAQFLIKHEK